MKRKEEIKEAKKEIKNTTKEIKSVNNKNKDNFFMAIKLRRNINILL